MHATEHSLKKFGLTDREIEVYIRLLTKGPASGYQIAKEKQMTKSTVYYLLDELRKKGLALKSPDTKRQLFFAKDPEEFLSEKRQDLELFEHQLPNLRALEHNNYKPNILYFEGWDGCAEAFAYMTERIVDTTIIAFLTYTPELEIIKERRKTVEHSWDTWAAKGIRIRGVQPKHITTRELIERYSKNYPGMLDIRELSLEVYAPIAVKFLTGNLLLMSTRRNGQSIIIENEDIANAERELFEMAWEKGVPFE